MRNPVLEPLWTAAASRAADAFTIETLGVPGIVLMEHAARATADAVRRFVPGMTRALVLAGPGNNGGDGWAVARHLWNAGIACPVLATRSPDELIGDARLAAQAFVRTSRALGWQVPELGAGHAVIDANGDVHALLVSMRADVIIDALFGTGLSRSIDGVVARLVDALAAQPAPVVAVDLPSGLPADGEAPRGPCVTAQLTVTFGRRRVGHASEPGLSLCGSVLVADIGLVDPPSVPAPAHLLVDASPLLPVVEPNAHKHRYGHVGVYAGRALGAARLAAVASLRAGAGLTSLILDDGPVIPEAELMVRPRDAAMLAGLGALVLGPGLGHTLALQAREVLAAAAEERIPTVVDAEAIDVLVQHPMSGLRVVATPHPGEAARVLGVTSADVQRDRLAAAQALSNALGPDVVLVLKGSSPIIMAHDHPPLLVDGACPALAVAGSGDVLAGCIAGLLARGLTPLDAALLGVWSHQRAGKLLEDRGMSRGWLATEIAAALPHVLHAPRAPTASSP